MADAIINKVAQSGLVSLSIEELVPESKVRIIDLADRLWQGLALREADLREWVKTHDWEQYRDCIVGINCSADALIPTWAYMLISSKLAGIARFVSKGSEEELQSDYHCFCIRSVDREHYRDVRVVVKGCADRELSPAVYMALTTHLQPVVKTLMFGEPCSTVPIYKQPRK